MDANYCTNYSQNDTINNILLMTKQHLMYKIGESKFILLLYLRQSKPAASNFHLMLHFLCLYKMCRMLTAFVIYFLTIQLCIAEFHIS